VRRSSIAALRSIQPTLIAALITKASASVKSQIPPGTYTSSLIALFEKGVRYASVVDVGCADGHFFLSHHALGIFPDASILNIDANAIYEESLKAIQDVVGGHYFIGAITDHAGEIEMTNAVHPYWNSLRPETDLYWERINRLSGTKVKVPAQTLDLLVARLQLKAPYLLKLDVQGAEVQALRGARRVLEETHAVICEADIDDFEEIDAALREAGFGLFDLTAPNWLSDRTLGWFYPVYLNHKLDDIRRRSFWDEKDNARLVQSQVDRRKTILEQNATYLARLRAGRKPT
jgi:FkbM family methyltransferase